MSTRELLAFFLLLFVLPAARARDWYLDTCTADPNLSRIRNNSCPPSLLLAATRLHGNPYHSLHDSAWAIVHFISSCLDKYAIPAHSTFLYLNVSHLHNPSLCVTPAPFLNRTIQPSWGACTLRAAFVAAGFRSANILTGPELPPRCFRAEFHFKATFRRLRYRTRRRARETHKGRGPRRLLPTPAATAALRTLSEAPFRAYALPRTPSRTDARVRVLLYDRQDVRRRQWANPEPVMTMLQNDPDVRVRRVSFMPLALAVQARMFQWADVIISPHGAGLANTVFMKDGADIIEVWKCCRQAVVDPEKPGNWTGWHAAIMGLSLRYVPCHPMEGPYHTASELQVQEHRQAPDQWCSLMQFRVRPDDVRRALDIVIPRQKERVRHIRNMQMTGAIVVYMAVVTVGLAAVRCISARGGVFGRRGK